MKTRYLLTHPEFGIYLGAFLGLGIWSQLDPCSQDHAVTFESPEDAEEYAATWTDQQVGLKTIPVTLIGDHATMEQCMVAGAQGWLTETMPAGSMQ